MKQIASRENPTYKALKALFNDAKELRRRQQTVLDGMHLLTAYCEKVGAPTQVMVSEQSLNHPEINAWCAQFNGEILLLGDKLFGALSELNTPTGILALVDIPQKSTGLAQGQSCVLLDAVQDPGNVGSILRTAAAAGIAHVFLGRGCAGAWTSRVIRSAQGAHFDLHLHEQADLAAVLQGFTGLSCAATAHRSVSLYQQKLNQPVAWLFGNEGAGIASELESLVQQRVGIPMASGSESLNVAAAAAVCLFEQRRQNSVR